MKKTGLALTIAMVLGLTGCAGGSGGSGDSHASLPQNNGVVINPQSTTTSTSSNSVSSSSSTSSSSVATVAEVNSTPTEEVGTDTAEIGTVSLLDTSSATTNPSGKSEDKPHRRSRRSVVNTSEIVEVEALKDKTQPSKEKIFSNGKTASQLPKVAGATPVSSTTDDSGKTRTVYSNGRVIYSYGNGTDEYWKAVTLKVNDKQPTLNGISFIDKKQAEKLLTELNSSVEKVARYTDSSNYILGYGMDFSSESNSVSTNKYPVKVKMENSKATIIVGTIEQPIDADDLANNRDMYSLINSNGTTTPIKFLIDVGNDTFLGSNGKELLAFGVKSSSNPTSTLNYTGKSLIWTKGESGAGEYSAGDFSGKFDQSAKTFTGTINTAYNGNGHLQLELKATNISNASFTGGTVTILSATKDEWKNKTLKFDGQFNGDGGKGTSGIIYTDSTSDTGIKGKIGGVYAGAGSEK